MLIVRRTLSSFPSYYSGLAEAQVSVRFHRGWDLFVLGQHVIEDVEEDVNVVLLENQSRTETDRPIPTASQEDTYQ